VNDAVTSVATLFEPREICLIIFFGEKDGLTIVSAPDHTRGNTRKIETWFSRHLNILVVEVTSENLSEFSTGCFMGTDPLKMMEVWDLPLRLFHWLLAGLVVAAYVTVELGGNFMEWHGRIGLAILGLLVFRLAWGLVGSTHARFASFLPTPRRLGDYLRGEWRDHGHNPLGALSVIAMLAILLWQAVSGLFGNDDIAFNGYLYTLVSRDTSDWMTGWHKRGYWFIIALVVLHLAAIAFYRRVKKVDLITPMMTGKKHVADPEVQAPRGGGWLAFALASALAIVVTWTIGSGILLPEPEPIPPSQQFSW
jgi:cytochrome b